MGKKTYRRELLEWVILITVGATLYFTGLHTQVIGQLQRLVLATGLIEPDIEGDENLGKADYDFTLVNPDGKRISLGDYSGKTLFINFWATWCPPCIAELPDIQNLHDQMKGEVTFLLISLDKDPIKAIEFAEKRGYEELPIYFPAYSIPGVYEIQSIPTTYVISPKGKIVVTRHGMAKYNTDEFRNFLRSFNESVSSKKVSNL